VREEDSYRRGRKAALGRSESVLPELVTPNPNKLC
jgi:hypothetical protein